MSVHKLSVLLPSDVCFFMGIFIGGDDVGMSEATGVFKLHDKVGSFGVCFFDDLQCNHFILAIVLSDKGSTIGLNMTIAL